MRVIILTTFEEDEYIFAAIQAGASGFLVKDTEPEDLVNARDRAQLVITAYETGLVRPGLP